MSRRFFIIHNPNAGRPARNFYFATLARLKASGASVEICETARHGDGTRVASEAATSGRFDAVVAAGGDGTVHDVAEGLLGTPIPLGIIPTGTANVFAREVGLPETPGELAKGLTQGESRTVPVGQANGRLFLFVVGVGFDAEAVRLFASEGNRRLGSTGLAWPTLKALLSHHDRPVRVTTPRGQSTAQWVIVTRAKRTAGGLLLAREADYRKERLCVLRMSGKGPMRRLGQLAALAAGFLPDFPGVESECAEWVNIDGDRATPVQIDGEAKGQLPLDIRIHPQRLRLLVFPH